MFARLLILGLLLRLSLVFVDFSFDVNSFIAWAKDASSFGLAGFYDRQSSEVYSTFFPNYPPIPIFLFTTSYWLYQITTDIAWQLNLLIPVFPSNLIFFLKERFVLAGFLKIPSILADLGIAYLIYLFAKKMAKKKNSSTPLVAAAFVLFNPAFFYTSSLWGQTDAQPIFFVLTAFYFLFYTKHYLWSVVFLTLSLLTKQTAIIFIPVYLIAFLKRQDFKNFLKSLFLSLVLFFGFFMFFINRAI